MISQNPPLTGHGAESGEMSNVTAIGNFETFLESMNTSSYDQQFRSYDHCKLKVLPEISGF
jgi:hypothetical protein